MDGAHFQAVLNRMSLQDFGPGICVIALLGALLAWHLTRGRSGKPSPPSPPKHWLWGNIPLVAENVKQGHHLDHLVVSLMRSLGRVFTLHLGPFKFTVVTDPDCCKQVLSSYNWAKSPTYKNLHPFIGERSMLVARAHEWHKQRAAFNPAFNYTFLKGLVPVFVSKARVFCEALSRAADSGEVLRMHPAASLLTLDIICQVAVSRDFRMQQSARKPELFTLFAALLDDCAYWAERPHLYWYRHYVPFLHRSLNAMQARLDGLIMDIIDEEIREEGGGSPRHSPGAARDILQLSLGVARSEGQALDKRDVLSQIKTFLFAGHDTTASLIAMAVYELAHTPDKEQRLVQEIRSVCGQGPEPSPSAEQLGAMPYLAAVIKEVLRLWPPGGTARYAPPGAMLQGYDVAGHVIYIPHFPLHRDPDVWGPDAGQFRPERWLEEAGGGGAGGGPGVHPYAYMPFSKGPRDCIGQTFALLEAKAVLTTMYARFTFAYAHSLPEAQASKITSHPKYGVPVRVAPRAI